jgi:reverse gyrase
MSRLNRLRKPIEDMSDDELHDLVRHIRSDRKLTKERPSTKRAVARTKDKSKTALISLLDSMTPEEVAALLGETGNADGSEGSTP